MVIDIGAEVDELVVVSFAVVVVAFIKASRVVLAICLVVDEEAIVVVEVVAVS